MLRWNNEVTPLAFEMLVGGAKTIWVGLTDNSDNSANEPTSCSGGASAPNGFLKVGKAFDKEGRCDVRHVEVVEQDCLIEIQACRRGFVEDENQALRYTCSPR